MEIFSCNDAQQHLFTHCTFTHYSTMPTLRRILKYTPAVVVGLLALAWVVSWFAHLTVRGTFAGQIFMTGTGQSTVRFDTEAIGYMPGFTPGISFTAYKQKPWNMRRLFGNGWTKARRGPVTRSRSLWLHVPIPVILTAWIPLAIGPFISFRFRLWHYLAYTALFAVELAYYLRWQD